MRWLVTAAAFFALVAGCSAPPAVDPARTTEINQEEAAFAPWWPVGSTWVMDLMHKGRSYPGLTLVNFWNDSATTHFWLGVPNKQAAFDHALNDSIPLLGRIHWYILTPHESGIHAAGMYEFPLRDGDRFSGLLMGREWEVTTKKGPTPGSFEFQGEAADGAKLRYDYQPSLMWFSYMEIEGPEGRTETDIRVREHKVGAQGTFYFYRGRDYYLSDPDSPPRGGQPAKTFVVKREDDRDPVALAVKIVGRADGLLVMELVDPEGQTWYSEPVATTGDKAFVARLEDPRLGEWKVRFSGTGSFQGEIKVVGLLEFRATL